MVAGLLLPSVPIFKSLLGRNNWIQTNIPLSIWKTIPGTQLVDALRGSGLAIREQTFFDLRREVLGLEKYQESLSKLRSESLVPKAWMEARPGFKLTSQAQYRFSMLVRDNETGELQDITRALASDRHYTKGELEELASSMWTLPSEASNYTLEEAHLKSIWTTEDPLLWRP